ncbi:MAG TPA: tetratricopeptide repeat protein [Fimbriimonadaceae bacterium]|nr:tetratricopeptide repeat protein [Fimbriimonadaceae bacterium]
MNDAAATFCIECGAPLSDDPASEGSDQEVYREITQANLNRIRGDYKDAVDVCLGILKRYPNNGTAHTLLGDIYAEQGELEQSAQWYEMALDLRPESQNDRRKLEAVQRRMSEQEAATTAKQLGIPQGGPRTQQYVYVIAILIAVVGTGTFLYGRSLGTARPQEKQTLVQTPIEIGRPTPKVAEQTDPKTPDTAEVQQPARTAWPGTKSDQQIEAVLATKYTVGRKLLSARSDPRGQSLAVTGLASPEDKPQSLAIEFARAVFLELPEINSVSIHIVAGDKTVYVADSTRTAFAKMIDERLDPETILTNIWPIDSP